MRTIDYRGWAGSLELANGAVRVVVVLAIGRVMHLGLADGPNLLWENAALAGRTLPGRPLVENGEPVWANFGGDRVWPSEESWFPRLNGAPRPLDPWIDGLPFEAHLLEDGPHLALVLLICLAWGGNFLSSAIALRELPALLFTALRLALVPVLLLPWLRAPAPGQWPRLLAICLCNGALHFGFSFWALRIAGDLASPAIVMQSYVPMTTLLAVLLLGERIGWRSAAGITASFGGVLVLGFDPLVLDAPLSLALMLTSALFLAFGTVLMRGLQQMHPLSLQAWSAAVGLVPLLAASAWLEGPASNLLAGVSSAAWAGVAYSALIASVLGHSLFFWLVQRHPVSSITPLLLIAPLIAIGLGIVRRTGERRPNKPPGPD